MKPVRPLRDILPGIWRWTRFSEEKEMNFNGYDGEPLLKGGKAELQRFVKAGGVKA